MVRVTTISRSEGRSTLVLFCCIFFPFQFLDDIIERIEAFGPESTVGFDPRGFLFQSAPTEFASPNPPNLFGSDQARLLKHADVLLHAGEGHLESLGEGADRCVGTGELLQNAAPSRIGERAERGIEVRLAILNHIVQYILSLTNSQHITQYTRRLIEPDSRAVVEAVYRVESRRLFARLVRALGDFDVAEDALQDAFRAAVRQWAIEGTPANPAGWLFQVAKFRGISILRKRSRQVSLSEFEETIAADESAPGDDLLRLAFTCCHPAIPPSAQVALTLREVCEMTTEQIAAAFLVPTPTIAQRIVRAKAKIREASIPFEVPSRDELPSRLAAVLKTIYLVFNEGYSSSSGSEVLRPDLMSLAIHLGRQLGELSDDPEVRGLLALMLIHQARSRTRSTAEGEIILLEDQDRTLWDRGMIDEANVLVESALRSGRFGAYTLQAAIAAVHADAASYAETDWDEIVGLYDHLTRVEPSPIVALNRAVAVAMRDGPQAGITQINALLSAGLLVAYHRAYAARGELFRRSGDAGRACADFETAYSLARQEPERLLIARRLAEIRQ